MYGQRTSEMGSYMSSNDDRESPEKKVIAEEDESLKDGLPQIPTEMFKGMDLPRSDTPDTYLTEIADKPDITLFCDQCHLFIDIRLLKHHRAYHGALSVLNYKGGNLPESSEQLLKKRNALLRRMKKEATEEKPLEPRQIQEMNEAYELLKADLEDTFEACRHVAEPVDTSCRGTGLSCTSPCVYAMGMCSSPNSRWKSEMEDTKVYQDSFGEQSSKCYLGLFDGYHGRFSAEVAASLLHKMLLHEMMKFDSSLKQGPAQSYDDNADISHHSFVFGSGASLDGERARKATGEEAPAKTDSKGGKGGDSVTVIQPDDDDLTRRIIQLCEEKHEKLLEELPPATTPKSSARSTSSSKAATKRCRHPMEEKILQAFEKSYLLMDILLSYGKDECSKVRWSGCSALSLVIEATEGQQQSEGEGGQSQGGGTSRTEDNRDTARLTGHPVEKGYVHLANSGDVRALLVRGNKTYRISKDHTPSNSKERDRIIREGGTLNTSEVDCRVNGILSTTRGLGNHGDPVLKRCVLVQPHTCSVQIDQYAQFIVMATSGVWEVLSDEEVGSLLMRMLPANKIPPPSKASSSLGQLFNAPQTPDQTNAPQNASLNEKGSEDAGVTEKEKEKGPEEGLKIPADLKTEVGSHYGDTEEDPAALLAPAEDQDTVTLPVHSQVDLGVGQETPEGRRRDLAVAMAEHIVQAALLAGSKNNITVMVVLLPGCGV